MKRILFIVLILILLGFACGKKNDTTQSTTDKDETKAETSESADVTMVFFNVPPHVIYDSDSKEVSGAVYELVQNYIAPEMGVTFKWETEPWTIPRQLSTLKENPDYAGAVLTYSSERAEQYAYSESPYFLSQTALLARKDNSLSKISVVDDILDWTIGYSGGTLITPFMKDERIKWDFLNHPKFMELNCEKVVQKRIDAAYAPDKAGLLTAAKTRGYTSEIKLLDLPEPKAKFHIAFSTGTTVLLEKYNDAFKKIDGARVYLEILEKYLDVSKL